MKIILLPGGTTDRLPLRNLYERAIAEAHELFIVTAYLTEWNPKSVIRDDCDELSFIVGKGNGDVVKMIK